MPTSLTELLVVLGLAAVVITGGICFTVAAKGSVEASARKQVTSYTRWLDSEAGKP